MRTGVGCQNSNTISSKNTSNTLFDTLRTPVQGSQTNKRQTQDPPSNAQTQRELAAAALLGVGGTSEVDGRGGERRGGGGGGQGRGGGGVKKEEEDLGGDSKNLPEHDPKLARHVSSFFFDGVCVCACLLFGLSVCVGRSDRA